MYVESQDRVAMKTNQLYAGGIYSWPTYLETRHCAYCTHTHTNTHTHTQSHIHTHTHIYLYIPMFVCMYVYKHVGIACIWLAGLTKNNIALVKSMRLAWRSSYNLSQFLRKRKSAVWEIAPQERGGRGKRGGRGVAFFPCSPGVFVKRGPVFLALIFVRQQQSTRSTEMKLEILHDSATHTHTYTHTFGGISHGRKSQSSVTQLSRRVWKTYWIEINFEFHIHVPSFYWASKQYPAWGQ